MLILSSLASAEKLTIVSTDFVLERKFEMLQRAAEGTGLEIDWVQVGVHEPARIGVALDGAHMVIIDAPRSDDQALVQGAIGDFLNRVDIPILSINVMSPPMRMRGVRLESEHAQRLFNYYAGGTSVNFNRLAQYAQALLTGASVAAIEPALELPERAIYHPDYESLVFSDLDTYLDWWQGKYGLSVEGKPVIGMEMSSSYISDGQTGMMDRFALEVREAGAVPVILYRSSRVASTRAELSSAQGGGRPESASGSGRPAGATGSNRPEGGGRPTDSGSPASSTAAHSDPNSTDVSQDFMNPLAVATLDLSDDSLVMRNGEVFLDVIVINTFLGSDPEGRKAWLKAL
ncbi:MAG: cobaltochelatase subunit CobN, partial [Pseudohongiella sp.]|nr:cobaltochelatase subunit CobN [Pseudohongiella sp.]